MKIPILISSSKATCALLSALLLLSACTRGPETQDTATGGVEAQPINGESYHTRDGRSALTLISSEELEYRLPDGTTLLCKYSKQQDAFRVVMTTFGTQQVLYFRRVPNGVMSNDGILYLDQTAYAEIQRQNAEVQRQREAALRAQQEAQAAEDRKQAEIAAEQDRQRKKRDDLVQVARTNPLQLGEFECVDFGGGMFRFVITSASVTKEPRGGGNRETIWFDELVGKPSFSQGARYIHDRQISLQRVGGWGVDLYCRHEDKTAAGRSEELYKLIENAADSWRSKYPDLAPR